MIETSTTAIAGEFAEDRRSSRQRLLLSATCCARDQYNDGRRRGHTELERCRKFQVHPIRIAEGKDGDTESVEVHDLAVCDAPLLHADAAATRGVPVGYGEAKVVKAWAFGIECVAGGATGRNPNRMPLVW